MLYGYNILSSAPVFNHLLPAQDVSAPDAVEEDAVDPDGAGDGDDVPDAVKEDVDDPDGAGYGYDVPAPQVCLVVTW